ncbi:exodeoxyribonuclease III [Mytilus galloprovincialis]|uniref:exodeoxyribonuclease III n=1 Tax=Mytilus galloprovincialis TaxID=29158 RepID=A0A8B6HBC4_MYTGA|nr:exodeoxyribonuclease III [Mytilus galloprovincialis]
MSISIVSLNVNGMVDNKKRNAVFYWCKKKNIDVICLQETHSSSDVETKWKNEWKGESFWNHGSSNSKGVAILFSEKFKFEITETGRDSIGRTISVHVKTPGNNGIFIYNIYAPNLAGDRKSFFEKDILIDNNNRNIVLGDFNCALIKNLDRKPVPLRDDIGSHELKTFVEHNELIDVWRKRYPKEKQYTFCRGNSRSRIDYIFISSELQYKSQQVKLVYFPFSDHDGVFMKLKTNEPERGPGTWKMNSSVIQSDLFRNTFESFWGNWKLKKNHFENNLEWWEETKIKIKSITIEVAKQLNITEKQIREWEKRLDNITGTHPINNENELNNLKVKIKDYYAQKAEAVRIRSKVNWYEKGEKSTGYFFKLEKKRGAEKIMD